MQHTSSPRHNARRSRRFIQSALAFVAMLVPNVAFAFGPSTGDSYSWVWATLVSVLIVSATWLASGTAMRALIRLRWIRRGRKVQFNRTLNVLFGALLLLALVLPYLVVTSAVGAAILVAVFLGGALSATLFRRPATDSEDIQLQ